MAAFELNGIQFFEFSQGSPEEAWGQDNSRITAQWKVLWEDRRAAKAALLGANIYQAAALYPNSYISRIPPHVYPTPLEGNWLYCVSVPKIEPIAYQGGKDAIGTGKFAWAKITAIYEGLDYDIISDAEAVSEDYETPDESLINRFVDKTVDDSSQFLSTLGGAWVWADGPNIGKPVTQDVPLLIPKEELLYTWMHVPKAVIPEAVYRAAQGCTNDDVFDGYEAGTLLYMGRSLKNHRWSDGTRTVHVGIKMKNFPNGVNSFPDRLDANNFHGIVAATDGVTTPFVPYDFRSLFRPV